jgi:hypothetical protein
VCCAVGCSKADSAASKADPPDDKMVAEIQEFLDKLKSLPSPADFEAFPANQRNAARAVAASLEANGENPSEFHAMVTENRETIVFDLWHQSAFTRMAEAAKNHGYLVGNPGRCRNVYYDREKKQVTKTLGWQ